jgi:hypothetical protein
MMSTLNFEHFAAIGIEVATQASYGNMRYAYFDTHGDLIGGLAEVLQRDPMTESMVSDDRRYSHRLGRF